jgi:hypothetical protein
MATNIVDTVIIFRILRKLTTPFNKTAAFKAGVIDAKGSIIVKPRDRTPAQKKTITLLDRMVFNLKRLLAKVPGGKTQLGTYIAALALLKEYVDQNHGSETSQVLIEKMQGHKIIPPVEYDLSTQEGFMDAWEDAMFEMYSGAGIGGAMSGMGTNAQVNATGMAGVDPMLFQNKSKKKKKDIRKILDR